MDLTLCFAGKKVLITGASRGIGRALVSKLHEYNAIIHAVSKNEENLAKLKSDFPNIKTYAVDLSNWDETREKISKIEPVEFLVNNAGISDVENILDSTPQMFDSLMNVNVKSALNVSQIVAKKMIENSIKGSILNISSLSGKKPVLGFGVYSISKAALDMLTKSLAIECGKYKIRVNSLNPGGVETDMGIQIASNPKFKELIHPMSIEEYGKLSISKIPLGEMLMPMEQVINTALFILSNEGRLMTGACVPLDAGQHI